MKNKNLNNQAGFTLIETFVAITILLIAVLGPLTVLSRSIVSSTFAKNEITAYYLAQSSLEDVLNYQKSDLASCSGVDSCSDDVWLGDLTRCLDDTGCDISTNASTFQVSINTCNSNKCTFVKRTPDGVYSSISNITANSSYGVNETSREFYRKVKIIPEDTDGDGKSDSAKVEVSIRWDNGVLGERSFVLSTYIFNYLTN